MSDKGLLFVRQVRALVNYCEGETYRPTSKEKLELLAFCILTELDGDGGVDGIDLTIDGESVSGDLHEQLYGDGPVPAAADSQRLAALVVGLRDVCARGHTDCAEPIEDLLRAHGFSPDAQGRTEGAQAAALVALDEARALLGAARMDATRWMGQCKEAQAKVKRGKDAVFTARDEINKASIYLRPGVNALLDPIEAALAGAGGESEADAQAKLKRIEALPSIMRSLGATMAAGMLEAALAGAGGESVRTEDDGHPD